MKTIAIAVAALTFALSAPVTHAQETFPSRLITVVNPNAPGGTSDIITRGMTEPLQRAFKQTVVTVNRVGAGGAVGGLYVAKAPADGYTVLLNTVTHVLIPITEQVLGRPAPLPPFSQPSRWRRPRLRGRSRLPPTSRRRRYA